MSIREADAIVVGTGSIGSMASWQLAARGLKVIAIDRFPIPGPFSGYAGESRLFRKLYAEGAHYIPLLQRAQQQWEELERATGSSLIANTGTLSIYDEDDPAVETLLTGAKIHGLDFEVLRGAEVQERFPFHQVRSSDVAILDPAGGYLRSEQAVTAAVLEARRLGVEFLERRALSLDSHGGLYRVRTEHEDFIAPKIVLAPGTGASSLARALHVDLALRPQALTWFPIRDGSLLPAYMPTFQRRTSNTIAHDEARFYGFPSSDGWTVKVVASQYMDQVASTDYPLTWDPAFLNNIRRWVAEFLPSLIPDPVRVQVCTDAHTPDKTALFGPVPGMEGVIVATGFSGHGFKFAAGLGAIAAELLLDGTSDIALDYMNPTRFLSTPTAFDTLSLS